MIAHHFIYGGCVMIMLVLYVAVVVDPDTNMV